MASGIATNGASTRRLQDVFRLAAIGLVVAFVAFLGFLLFFVGGEGHGADMSAMAQHQDGASSNATHMGGGSMGGSTSLAFGQPFGFIALALSAAYLATIAVWARVRGKSAFLTRHVAAATIMLVLVVLYLNARGSFNYNGHDWNRSFADASVVLYAVTLAIGPLARLWRPAGQLMDLRRETGIWATIAAIIHVGIFWEWSFGWGDWRRFFYPANGAVSDTLLRDRASGTAAGAFQVANVVGLVALAYAIVLTITSNDASLRSLKSGWSWIMKRATTMQVLVLLHTWLFAYYVTREQTLPVGTLWVCFWFVLLLQTLAFMKTVLVRRQAPS